MSEHTCVGCQLGFETYKGKGYVTTDQNGPVQTIPVLGDLDADLVKRHPIRDIGLPRYWHGECWEATLVKN